jgi:hypothetical protein
MKETGKERFILTKAYEVAYALFRLAAQMQEKDFAEQLRASGTHFFPPPQQRIIPPPNARSG